MKFTFQRAATLALLALQILFASLAMHYCSKAKRVDTESAQAMEQALESQFVELSESCEAKISHLKRRSNKLTQR